MVSLGHATIATSSRLAHPLIARIIFTIINIVYTSTIGATTFYLSPDDFAINSFNSPPAVKTLWVTKQLNQKIKLTLGHKYHKLRIRYWAQETRSVWVLDEIGKEHYITVGFVIEDNIIRSTKILVYRETRGWEVKLDFFTRQFEGATLTSELALDRQIDGISGATLSVNAVKNLAQTALLLHQWINKEK